MVRVPKAYPIYDASTPSASPTIRAWLDGIANLQQIGRNGLHRYNNSDHSMLTAMRAVENLCDGAGHDIWAVNADSAYHERQEPDEQPYLAAPETPAMPGRWSRNPPPRPDRGAASPPLADAGDLPPPSRPC